MAHNGCIVCTVNPKVGRYTSLNQFEKSHQEKKNVAIVGGGPGGLQAAITAAEAGHTVCLYEQSDALGGVLNSFDGDPLKADYQKYKNWLMSSAKLLARIKLNTRATPELLKAEQYDAVILALGASPVTPPIPGLANGAVIPVHRLFQSLDQVGEHVTILGGGISGCEAAYSLAEMGKHVVIVEQQPQLALGKENQTFVYTLPLLLRIMRHANIEVKTDMICVGIEEGNMTVRDKDGELARIDGDCIVTAIGTSANWDETEKLFGVAPQMIPLGDCVVPGRIADATGRAYFAALAL